MLSLSINVSYLTKKLTYAYLTYTDSFPPFRKIVKLFSKLLLLIETY